MISIRVFSRSAGAVRVRAGLPACLLALLMLFQVGAARAVEKSIALPSGLDVTLDRYPAEGPFLVLWVASRFGFGQRSRGLAEGLAGRGMEVWQVDLAEAHFVPRGARQMRAFTGQLVAGLLRAAHARTGKTVLLMSQSGAAIPVLRGVRHWQAAQPRDYLAGVLMLSPDLFQGTPALGREPEFLPIAAAVNVPLMILQEGRRGNRWYIRPLMERLAGGGAPVYAQVLAGVTGLLHEEDAAVQTLAWFQRLPGLIRRVAGLLERTPHAMAALPLEATSGSRSAGLDTGLKVFGADWAPSAIELPDASGRRYVRDDFKGQVTVLNFWASWCPPCVEEIPSLNRLREQMAGEDFELVSVNYAESPAEVRAFLERVEVRFPVLMDESGAFSARWRVVAFPSTFVIDTRGRIRYGVNAAIHWDAPEVVEQLRALLAEAD